MASTSSLIPFSSPPSTSIPPWNYDVFLSFRGEDTRYTFTDHLYRALVRRGLRTFRDDKLIRGEEIAVGLLKVIEESRFSIIVFSENYAHSRWCLDELVKIMECRKDLRQTVFPIFYHVDPSHVRKQTASFGEALANYREEKKEKVQRWMSALTEAANLAGAHVKDGYESERIKQIADNIFCKLNHERLDVGANLVGMDSHIKEMRSRLDMESNDVRMVGIYGVGGIGKTTIAKVLYNKFSCEFECMSFLKNIREVFKTRGLFHLQNQLLGDILDGEASKNISNVDHGATMIKTVLQSKRVFIVLDDVDGLDQLEYLLGGRDWLGKGSRVIITTRDRHLLTVQGVDNLYEVEGLNFKEAYELFSLYAFKQNFPQSDFINLSNRVVYYCHGLPLALKVLGSLLFGNTIHEWESELHKLERVPESEIQNVLKISLERLDHTEKNIFLDIACFFKGEGRDFVSRILDGCNFYAEKGIKNLNDKCLISMQYNRIEMHDLIQQMGWEVVREKYPNEPDKWSRLWDPLDIERALRINEGIKGVETISLDLSKLKRMRFNSNVFAKMTRLRLLKVHSTFYLDYLDCEDTPMEDYDVVMKDVSKMQLDLNFEFPSYELRYLWWDGYPLDYLPSSFDGANLIELHLKCSNIKQLWQGNECLDELKVIDLSYSKKLIQMPEFSSMPNLERLILQGCVSLTEIHPSVGVLKKLTALNLRRCEKLKGFPSSIMLESFHILNLSKCSSFDMFPKIQGNMRCIRELPLNGTPIRELPCKIGYLESLVILDFSNCSKFEKFPENGENMKSLRKLLLKNTAIKNLPDDIGNLESLEILDLSNCSKFEKFPEKGGNMKSLRELLLKNTAIKDLPDDIGNLESLEILDLSNCSKFEKFPEKGGNMKSLRELLLKNTAIKDLPDDIGNLESLQILDLSNCSKFEKFPEKGGNMKSLSQLLLKNTATKDLPDDIGNLESLQILDLSNCSKFEKFPEKGGNMKSLRELLLKNTAIKDLPDDIGNLESLVILDLSNCSKFEKFPEKGGNMKSLRELLLKNTATKDLPDGIGNLESLEILDLSNCSKFEKFPEKGGNIKSLRELLLKNTAAKDLPDGIGNLESLEILDLSNCSKFEKFPEKGGINELCNLRKLNISHCKMLREIPELPSNLEEIDAHDCTSREDLSSLFWSCHLYWLIKSSTQNLGAVFPGSSGILEWMRYQNKGSDVAIELPMNWYEDTDFLGLAISCLYHPVDRSDSEFGSTYDISATCAVSFPDYGLKFEASFLFSYNYECHGVSDMADQVWVWWCPKMAIFGGYHLNKLRLNASFCNDISFHGRYEANFKKCGVNLIFSHDHQCNNFSGNLGDANVLCPIKHKGGIGSVAQNMGVFKRSCDDFLPSPMEGSHHIKDC